MDASGCKKGAEGNKLKFEPECSCEATKVKELYDDFYGQYVDHIGGISNVGQRGKLPHFVGPKLWVPPWLEFTKPKGAADQSVSTKAAAANDSEEDNNIQQEKSDFFSEIQQETAVEVCKCGETCYHKSKSISTPANAVETLSLSEVQLEEIEAPKPVQKKKESIQVKNLQHTILYTPSVVLSKLESRMKSDINPSYITLITFMEIAIKAVRIKIARYKHRSKFAAMSFSGSKKKIIPSIAEIFVSVMTNSGCCYQIYVNGEEDIRLVPAERQGPYIVCLTGLSGGIKNLKCSLELGSIFSIYKRDPKLTSYCSKTANLSYKYLVSAGYALYSTSTKLVMSTGTRLLSFVLDPVVQEFILHDDNIRIPDKGTQISVHEGHSGLWEPQILEYMKRKKDPKQGKPLKARYVGCLVADFHRTLYLGGIYLYPANRKYPQGKTTLLCECIPLAHIAHLAGGTASTGRIDVLKMEPDQLGQFIPFFVGSKKEVEELLLITSTPSRG
ncbi:Fructose-1,6-bisphosphatase [Nesidiocoris tenuis]|nr:Fructose-1,6-bisphosphatase [Nesidiocoris tenuis]